ADVPQSVPRPWRHPSPAAYEPQRTPADAQAPDVPVHPVAARGARRESGWARRFRARSYTLWASRSGLARLPQLLRQTLGQIGPAMELCRSVLEEDDAPLPLALDGNERLHRVERWCDLRLAGRYHARDRAQQRHIGREQACASHLPHILARGMVSEDLSHGGGDHRSAYLLAPVEADDLAVFRE